MCIYYVIIFIPVCHLKIGGLPKTYTYFHRIENIYVIWQSGKRAIGSLEITSQDIYLTGNFDMVFANCISTVVILLCEY